MILASHGIIGSSIVQFDADYVAILNYATTQGYTLPSASQRIKQNKLLVDLKAAGVWSKLDTFAVFATDGNSDFALIDWKRLVNYTGVNVPTFTTNEGFTGNGTDTYISTNFNPATNGVNYTLNNASRFMWNKATSITNRGLDGNLTNSVNGMSSSLTGSTNHRINTGGAFTGTGVVMNIVGLISIHKNNSATDIELFTNTNQFTRVSASSSISSTNQLLWRNGNASTLGTAQTAIYGMGASLVSENTTLRTILDTYLTSL